MNRDTLQDMMMKILQERNARSSGAGPSDSSLLQREFLSYMRGSRQNDRDSEEDFRGRMRRDEVGQRMRGPRDFYRGRYGSDDDESPERYSEISTEPQFTLRADVEYRNILGLFERNSAHLRNRGIAVLIRGPKNCGQNSLAKMILQKEKSIGNAQATHLSSRELKRDRRERFMMERFSDKLSDKFNELVREKKFSFYVIEIGSSLSELQRFHQIASNFAKFTVFLIECNQPEEVIQKNAKNQSDLTELKEEIEEMKRPISKQMSDLIMLDAAPIYKRDRLLEKVNNAIDRNIMRNDYGISAHKYREPRADFVSNSLSKITKFPDPEDKQQVKEAIKNPEFAQLIKSSFLGLQFSTKKLEKEKKPSEEFIKNLKKKPEFTPRSKTNHSNKIKIDQYDIAKQFRPDKIFEYEHRTTEKMLNILCRKQLDQEPVEESVMEVEK